MKKLYKLLKTFQLLLQKPSLVNLILESDYKWDTYVLKSHPTKTQLPVIQITDIVSNFNENLSTWSFLGGGSMPTDIMLLKSLASNIKDCSYFEIGTWRGESAVNVAETAKECYTLNLSKEEIKTLGLSSKYADLHGFFSKQKKNITHLYGNSITYDFKALEKKFDLIFIDGDHTYAHVKKDTQNIFKHLTNKNTIVVWHDYAHHPEKIRSEVLAGILDGIPSNKKEHLYHVSNTKCAIFYPFKINSYNEDFPAIPKRNFSIRAEATSLTSESS